MEVEFPGGVGGGGGGMNSNNSVKPNSVEVVLRLSWGCDNFTPAPLKPKFLINPSFAWIKRNLDKLDNSKNHPKIPILR